MIINWKIKRKSLKCLYFLEENTECYFWIEITKGDENTLKNLWFFQPYTEWKVILPDAAFGKTSFKNKEGEEIVRKDLPKETVYSHQYRTWMFRGKEYSWYVDIPYKKYIREIVYWLQLKFAIKIIWKKIILIVNKKFIFTNNDKEILIAINLLSEIFWRFEVFDKDIKSVIESKRMMLNWEILPPWKKVFDFIYSTVDRRYRWKKENTVIKKRFILFESLNPDFTAIGKWWFNGYVIFVFENLKIAFLESIYYWNAIYVFWENWKELSQKTKEEILNWKLEKERIVHTESYNKRILKYFKS